MEIKDLILLILMPLIVIIVLTHSNSITGNTILENEAPKIIGKYTIMPSFKVQTDFDLGKIKDLKSDIKTAIDLCKQNKDFKDCVEICQQSPELGLDCTNVCKSNNFEACLKKESDRLGWNCDEKSIAIHDFTDKLKDCKNLEFNDVVCRFNFDFNEEINQDNRDVRAFEIKLTNWYQKIKVDIYEADKLLKTEFLDIDQLALIDNYETKDRKRLDEIGIKLTYVLGKPQIQEFYGKIGNGKIELDNTFLFYKKDKEISFIDLSIGPSFIAVPPNTIIDLPKTKGMKFCVKDGDLEYNFAVTFPNE